MSERSVRDAMLNKISELEQENKELRTRVAELKDMVAKLTEEQNEDIRFQKIFFLEKRVAELEKAYNAHLDSWVWDKKNEELQTRLSTLLKASEGLEKAVEKQGKDCCHCDCWDLGDYLAEFRAVKEKV